eukprot:1161868-Pelagomonas_calceolata.AAC.10
MEQSDECPVAGSGAYMVPFHGLQGGFAGAVLVKLALGQHACKHSSQRPEMSNDLWKLLSKSKAAEPMTSPAHLGPLQSSCLQLWPQQHCQE